MESFQLFYSAEKIERGEQLHFLDFDEGDISAEERQGLPLNCGSYTWLGNRVQGVRGQAAGKVDREVQRRRKVSSRARTDEDSASHRQICFFGSKFWNGQRKHSDYPMDFSGTYTSENLRKIICIRHDTSSLLSFGGSGDKLQGINFFPAVSNEISRPEIPGVHEQKLGCIKNIPSRN
jgi:hypothetical protein